MTKQQREINELKKQVAELQAQVELLNRRPQSPTPYPYYVPAPYPLPANPYEPLSPRWQWDPYLYPIYSITVSGGTK